MSARDRILQRLGRSGGAPRPPDAPRPQVASDLLAAFLGALEVAAASSEVLDDPRAVPARVLAYRAQTDLAGPTAIAPALVDFEWPDEVAAEFGTTDGRAVLAVSHALAGVAETGSVLLASGPQTPTRLNFLSEHQIVVLSVSRIVRHLEDAWILLGDAMPRAVNLVTGPSRTADVEQTIQLGAHGPRSLHLLLTPD